MAKVRNSISVKNTHLYLFISPQQYKNQLLWAPETSVDHYNSCMGSQKQHPKSRLHAVLLTDTFPIIQLFLISKTRGITSLAIAHYLQVFVQ